MKRKVCEREREGRVSEKDVMERDLRRRERETGIYMRGNGVRE